MSSTAAANLSDPKEGNTQEHTMPAGTRRTKASSKGNAVPTLGNKFINDNAFHETTIVAGVLKNYNEIDYSSPGTVHLTTTAFRGAIITGGEISNGVRAAPRNFKRY